MGTMGTGSGRQKVYPALSFPGEELRVRCESKILFLIRNKLF
jgi:hypothetical protein